MTGHRRSAPSWPRSRFVVAVASGLLLAAVGSHVASSAPDGLERVAAEQGLDQQATDHALSDSPVADYSVGAVDDDRLAAGTAGVLGAVGTLAMGTGVAVLVRRAGRSRRRSAPVGAGPSTPP